MRGLFFKIFIIFWIAQSLIFVISTALILNRRFPKPAFLVNPFVEGLTMDSAKTVEAFEANGCEAVKAYAQPRRYTVALEDQTGKRLCDASEVPQGIFGAGEMNQVTSRRIGNNYILGVPVTSGTGKRYMFLMSVPQTREQHTWYGDLLHFAFPQLPVAIAVGGLTTFVLVLLFTRPVSRLRQAARELARGNLSTRVNVEPQRTRIFEGDEFQALLHDFNHMAERLESLVDAQKLLLRDVSHELRSPLARLSVALELSREDADVRMTTHLDRIQREAERLNLLIGQLLTLSSMEAVESMDKFDRFSLKKVLEEILPDAAYEARQRDASVVLEAGFDYEVKGRRELLYRAIENVVRNGIRYTEPSTQVNVRLFALNEQSARWGVVEISDRGPGIPESELDAIFRPFYRVDRARSAQTGGFGVGLAIAERAVKLHLGEIKAFNRHGGGTVIQMRLPLA